MKKKDFFCVRYPYKIHVRYERFVIFSFPFLNREKGEKEIVNILGRER